MPIQRSELKDDLVSKDCDPADQLFDLENPWRSGPRSSNTRYVKYQLDTNTLNLKQDSWKD